MRQGAESRFYWHCPKCDFIFLDDQHRLTPQEEFDVYENHENSIDDPKYIEFFMRFINEAVMHYTREKILSCLDFGSGPEPVLAELLKREYGWFVDIYDKFYAPEKTYKGKTYDLITSTEVVEHLDQPLHYFRLFKALLRPQGILSVMTLLHPGRHDFAEWFYINDPTHISFFSDKTMTVISAMLGFHIIYSDNKRYVTFTHA